jgi:SAM-dependent methyltransferase
LLRIFREEYSTHKMFSSTQPSFIGDHLEAFGCEYARSGRWTHFQQLYIRVFGIVDLATRIRACAVISALRGLFPDRFLDVGAGTGVYSLFLTRDSKCSGLALEIDPDRVEALKALNDKLGRSNLEIMCGDQEALSTLPSSDFTLILAIEVLQYFKHLERALLDLKRCLRPGGMIVVHVPFRDSLQPYEQRLFNDEVLASLFLNAGFENPKILHTFGPNSVGLCEIYSRWISRPFLFSMLYPFLLITAHLLPPFTSRGIACLLLARAPQKTQT